MRSLFLTLAAMLQLVASSLQAEELPIEVDVALVLALDTSDSIKDDEWQLQKDGYIEAFRHPEIIDAICRGLRGKIAVTMVQWANDEQQAQVIGWTLIQDERSSHAFSDKIAITTRKSLGSQTSISGAIEFSASLFVSLRYKAMRRIIDVSGDGSNSTGPILAKVREDVVAQYITINGLPIINEEEALDIYYRNNVIGGPGAFMVVAESFEQFAFALRRKLLLEIASR